MVVLSYDYLIGCLYFVFGCQTILSEFVRGGTKRFFRAHVQHCWFAHQCSM